jgi:transcription factor TGA
MLLLLFCQILRPQLEPPLMEQQLMAVCGLQQSSVQAEDALLQGMEKLQQNVPETLTVVDPFASSEACLLQMASTMDKLKELVVFVTQVTDQPNPWPPRAPLLSC